MSRLYLVRHGATAGNLEKRYVGNTDEALLPESRERLMELREKLAAFPFRRVYASPLRRCRETAAILCPELKPALVENLRECDFGTFEYRNYKELSGNAAYQRFIDSGGECGFPGGETRLEFEGRVCRAFLQLDLSEDSLLVVHGGTIMALMDRFSDPHRDYFEWQVKCGEGFLVEWALRQGDRPLSRGPCLRQVGI